MVIRSKLIVVISWNDTFQIKKALRFVAEAMTLGRKHNKINQTRLLQKKRNCKKHGTIQKKNNNDTVDGWCFSVTDGNS